MRATTAFNRLLALESTTVKAVRFDPDAIVVVVALRTRLLRCPDCDYTTSSAYDRRPNPGAAALKRSRPYSLGLFDREGDLGCPHLPP